MVEAEVEEAMKNAKGNEAYKRGAGENALRQLLGLPRKFQTPTRDGSRGSNRPRTPRPDQGES